MFSHIGFFRFRRSGTVAITRGEWNTMNDEWQIRVYEQQRLVYTAHLSGPAELGRQSTAEEVLYSQHSVSGRRRVVIAHRDEKSVSRQHAFVEPIAEGGFRLTNLSAERPISLPDGMDLKPK